MQYSKQPQSNKKNENHHDCGGGLKHMLMMLVCCMLPLGVILTLEHTGYDGMANYLILILCPLMHLFMMRRMGRRQQAAVVEKWSS